MPYPTPHKASEFRWGFPYLLPTLLDILHGVSRVRFVGLKAECFRWRVLGCPFRSLRLPSIDTGYVRLTCVTFRIREVNPAGPYAHDKNVVSALLADIASKVCQGVPFPKGYARFV